MPHQLESWYPRRCRRRGRFRVTPWRLGLDRLLALQGHPFGRSVSAALIASRPYEPLPTREQPKRQQHSTDGLDQGGQRPRTLLMPQPPTQHSPSHPLLMLSGVTKVVRGPALAASGK